MEPRAGTKRGGPANLNRPMSGKPATFRGKLALVQGAGESEPEPVYLKEWHAKIGLQAQITALATWLVDAGWRRRFVA